MLVDVSVLRFGSELPFELGLEDPEPPVVRGTGGRVILDDDDGAPEEDGITGVEEETGVEDEGIPTEEDEGR